MSGQLKSYQSSMFGLYHHEAACTVNKARLTSKGQQLKADDKKRVKVAEGLAKAKVSKPYIDEFLKYWSPKLPALNSYLSGLGSVEAAVDVGKFFYTFRAWGYSTEQVTRMLVLVVSLRSEEALRVVELTLKHGPKVQKALEFAGAAGLALNVFAVGVQCASFAKQGEYSQLVAALYKFGMGLGIKWAGAIDAVQSLVELFVPETKQKNSTVFKVIRAVDPIGLGGTGVDSVVFFVQAAIDSLRGKSFDERRLASLVERMKTGPTRIFAEIGEEAGDALYDIMQWDAQDWKVLVTYSWQELTGAFRTKSL
jgi:hypothetical protein